MLCVVQLFSVRYEAAKLIEEEQEAEIEEAERRKALEEAERRKALADVSHDRHRQPGKSSTLAEKHGSAGGWHESESGMFLEPGDSSVLDSSSDGLAVMHAARQQAAALAGIGTTASQDDDENYTKGQTSVLHLYTSVSPSVIFVNENENENGEKRENNEFVNAN